MLAEKEQWVCHTLNKKSKYGRLPTLTYSVAFFHGSPENKRSNTANFVLFVKLRQV